MRQDFREEEESNKSCLKISFMTIRWRSSPYMKQDALEGLKNFKYAGGDISYGNAYFYQPVSAYLVEKVPRWVAPNLVSIFLLFINN